MNEGVQNRMINSYYRTDYKETPTSWQRKNSADFGLLLQKEFGIPHEPNNVQVMDRYYQCCQNFRAPNSGKLAFLPVVSDFKVAQFLSSNHTPNFPNLGTFQL